MESRLSVHKSSDMLGEGGQVQLEVGPGTGLALLGKYVVEGEGHVDAAGDILTSVIQHADAALFIAMQV